MYLNVNNPVNYQLQGFGQNGVRTISIDQLYIQGEYYRVLVAEEDSYVTAVSVLGDDLTAEFVYAGTTIYGLFTEVSVTSGSLTAYIAGPTDIEDVWAYINAYGEANAATIEAADCAKDAIAPLLDKYYAKASLVMVPSLYKTSIVYSERPLTSDGQLAFTRSNDTATRVGPDGLIEKVRTNVVTYSQDFSDASWTKTALTISTSATANPVNGALTAQDAIPTAVSSLHRLFKLAGVVSTANTWSIFAKAKGYNFITIIENGNTSASVSFNLSTGAVSTQISAVGQIQSLGNGWFRCSMIHTTATTPRFDVFVSPTDSQAAYTADGTSGVTLFGAQAEASDFGATPYIATTTAAVSVGMLANVPRLDYLGSSCPRLLLEPQRQNVITFSEQIDNAAWTKTGVGVTANNSTSPDGNTNADKLFNSVGTTGFASQTISLVSSTIYSGSVFAKNAGRDSFFVLFSGSGGSASCTFNLTTLTTTPSGGVTAKIEDYGGGWYRCSVVFTATSTGASAFRIYPSLTTGDGTSGLYFYGAQVEAAAYATSYIPTLGAAVTRGADACSKTGISSLIGSTEGVIFAEVQGLSTDTVRLAISDGTNNNNIYIELSSSNVSAVGRLGGVNQFAISSGQTITNNNKIAIKYKQNDFALYVNGVQVGTDTSGNTYSANTLNALRFDRGDGGIPFYGNCKQLIVFPTALTNQELQDLTTL